MKAVFKVLGLAVVSMGVVLIAYKVIDFLYQTYGRTYFEVASTEDDE